MKGPLDVDSIIEKVETDYPEDTLFSEEDFRIVAKRQSDLRGENKWSHYLFAPPEYWELRNHPSLIELDEVTTMSNGTKTGANRFFFVTQEDVDEWSIEDRFLRRSMKSVTQFEGLSYESEDSEFYLLDCHDFVQEILNSGESISESTREEVQSVDSRYVQRQDETPRSLSEEEVSVTAAFYEQGYEGIYSYILWGVEEGFHTRNTCSQRRIWFDLGELPASRLVSPQTVRGRPFFPVLSEQMPVSNRFYYINVDMEEHVKMVAGFLNSSVGKLWFELHGRTHRGGLGELRLYELRDFPIIDPQSLSENQRNRIDQAFDTLAETGVHEEEAQKEVKELDRAVLAPFGMEDRAEEIAAVATAISKARQEEREYEIPVEIEEERKTVDIAGAERIEDGGQSTLNSF